MTEKQKVLSKGVKIIRQAISKELADFIYQYFLNKRQVAKKMFDDGYISPFANEFGVWSDPQVPNTYSHYGDIVFDTLLEMKAKPILEEVTGLKLNSTYTYARIYKKGDILRRHFDRYSCEVSATMHIGGDTEWPIYIDPTGGTGEEGTKAILNPGDMLQYKGVEMEHWREAYEGKDYCQAFLHANDASDANAEANKFDGRPLLGAPDWFRGQNEKNK